MLGHELQPVDVLTIGAERGCGANDKIGQIVPVTVILR